MNARERFHALMRFEPGVRTLDWEFGYWAGAIDRWYHEGLRRSPFSPPPGFPAGTGIHGEGLPHPDPLSNICFRDYDVHLQLGLDPGSVRIPINWRFSPAFEPLLLEADETTQTMINRDGATIRVRKSCDSPPHFLAGPVKDRASWEKIKEERFNTDRILDRLPGNWAAGGPTYRQREFPLGVVMDGFFSLPRELFLVEHQLMTYYTDPELMHDVARQMVKVWLAMLEEILAKTDLDYVYIWEDMSFKNGPLLSPALCREFMMPYYRQVTGFLRARGIENIFVDTDGNCWLLIPEFLQAGVAGLYPFEVQSGMDIVEVRKAYPGLRMMGGLDKIKLAQGKEAIDAELEAKLPAMLTQGGYIPFADHLIQPEVSWENFCYYRRRIKEYIERYPTRATP